MLLACKAPASSAMVRTQVHSTITFGRLEQTRGSLRFCFSKVWKVIYETIPAGGEEERWAKLQGVEPPSCVHKAAVKNVAPRANSWRSSRSNTQTPSITGPVSVQPSSVKDEPFVERATLLQLLGSFLQCLGPIASRKRPLQ